MRRPLGSNALVAALLLAPGAPALGQTATEEGATQTGGGGYPEIRGNVGVGALVTTGNTESESANADFETQFEYEIWRHTVKFSAYRASENGVVSGERYTGSLQSDYKFTERAYLFANVNFERDRFGSFDRRAAASVGLGRRFLETAAVTLDLEAGVGRRVLEPADTNDRVRETIGRFHGHLAWAFSDVGELQQDLQVETGESNTYSESVTTLRSKLTDSLSWRLSYTIKHNSDVPAGTEKTDTLTALSLEYGF